MKDSLLVVGGTGVVGRALVERAQARGKRLLVTTRSGEAGTVALDLANVPDDWRPNEQPGAAILCAAATRIQWCDENPALARRVNLENTTKLARSLVEAGTFVVLLSTNLVFDGSVPKTPAEAPFAAVTVYGELKAEAEATVRELGERAAIVRLSKVFHPMIQPMLDWTDRLDRGETVEAFVDYRCSPVWIDQVVDGLLDVAVNRRSGVHQFSPQEEPTYADIARGLAHRLGRDEQLVLAVGGRDRLPNHHFPQHTTLDASTTERALGVRFASATEVLDRFVDSWRARSSRSS